MRSNDSLMVGVLALAVWGWPHGAAAQRASGTGQQATAAFHLAAGLAIFEMEHRGDGDFVLRLLDDRGVPVDTLARGTGPFRGSKAVHVPRSGAYLYDVVARGAWTMALRNPSGGAPDDPALRPPLTLPGDSSGLAATTSSLRQQAAIDAEQLARRKGAFPWLLGGLGGGMALGPVGAGLVFVAANRPEHAPPSDVNARRDLHGQPYADAFAEAYQTRRRSDRRVAALVGGTSGTIIFGFVVAQVINWSRKSGGTGGPGNGELP